MKKYLMVALLSAGLTAGCGDEDGLSPGARNDAATDTNQDAPVKTDGMPPKLDANPDVAVDGSTPPPPDAGVDGPSSDAAGDSQAADADLGDALTGDALTDVL